MLAHSEMCKLARHQLEFPLIAEYLSGALTEVAFERDGRLKHRIHAIVDMSCFPLVKIAVEGSSGAPTARQLFARRGPYENAFWELADPKDERLIAAIIERGAQRSAAAIAAGEAELARRVAARVAEEQAAEARRTAPVTEAARARIIIAWRSSPGTRGWRTVLQDLDAVRDDIRRQTDRMFIADNAAQARRKKSNPSEKQIRWLGDILARAGKTFAARGAAACRPSGRH